MAVTAAPAAVTCVLATGAAMVEARIMLDSVGIILDLKDEQPPLKNGDPGVKTYTITAPHSVRAPHLVSVLTLREHQILRLLTDGLSNDEAGVKLGLSGATVKTHLQRLFKKIGANDRAHAVAIAFRHGILGGAS